LGLPAHHVALHVLPPLPAQAADIVPVYFGNGCFWGRQFDYVQAEKALGRDAVSMSAVAGYAGVQWLLCNVTMHC
jgi:peptide methionine sulfoxide reductase MsrA